MWLFMILTILFIELLLVIHCIRTKSVHQQIRSSVRIGVFVLFIVLSIMDVIMWSARYYGITTVLLIMAIYGGTRLKYETKQTYRLGRIIRKSVLVLSLLYIALLPAVVFPQYRKIAVTGDYKVGVTSNAYTDYKRIETFKDSNSNRELNVSIWYPKDREGEYPLIIFSHGGISVKSSNESLYRELASHGYIIVSIDHPYHSIYTKNQKGETVFIDRTYMNELNAEDAKTNPIQSFEYYQKWMNLRVDDINFVIDSVLLEGENHLSPIYNRIDSSNMGVMGHSLGGSAALCIGRIREDIKAVLALESPFMCDIVDANDDGFEFDEDPYPTALLNVYSDSSWIHLEAWPQYQQNVRFITEAHDDLFNIHIGGVGHFDLSDLALTSPIMTRMLNGFQSQKNPYDCLETINAVALEFFDSYLKGEGEFTSEGTY